MTPNQLQDWISLVLGVVGLVGTVGGMLAWYRSAGVKAYAAEREFGHIKGNLENLNRNLDLLLRDLDSRLDRIESQLAKFEAILLTRYRGGPDRDRPPDPYSDWPEHPKR